MAILRNTLLVVGLSCLVITGADAQVVQLPSIHVFSSTGSVLVPDSGGAYLGGRNSYASSIRSRFRNRASGVAASAGGASVHVTIIDTDAIDRQILGYDPKQRHSTTSPESLARRTEEGKQLVRFARAQYRSGKLGAAFDAYQVAIGVLTGELRELAIAEMRRVFPASRVRVASAN